MRRTSLSILLLLACCSFQFRLAAQNHANNWYFGDHAGLTFNSGNAVPITGMQVAYEGGTSYSDHQGNLLFYTDGLTVWNRNHVAMVNGTGLIGGLSSTTSALVVRHPGNCKQYFLFTVEDHMSVFNSLRYSVIDMNLNGGLGGVVVGSKNILITNYCTEKITAVRHQNGTDMWIITHHLNSTNFAAYRLTPAGFNPVPVISTVGPFTAINCMIGFMKANHAGTKLVTIKTFCNGVEMYDFNKATGVISNPQVILGNLNGCYGVEFSPNDNIIYINKTYSGCALYQVNATNLASTYLVASAPGNYTWGGLQLGPNGRIYMAKNNQASLAVVNSPNVWGAGCGFAVNGQPLSPGTLSGVGIVSFPPEQVMAYFPGGYSMSPMDTCFTDFTQFAAQGLVDYDSIRWNFGDPVSGVNNTDTGSTTGHTFTLPGSFQVTMYVFGCEPDTIVRNLTILNCPFPVGLTLSGVMDGNNAWLSWAAADLAGAERFEIERSMDGTLFSKRGEINANSRALAFVDHDFPAGEEVHYRIRQINGNSGEYYSNVVTLSREGGDNFSLELFPIPQRAGEPVHGRFAVSETAQVSLTVFDAMGKRVMGAEFLATAPQARFELATEGLAPGCYFLQMRTASGTCTRRFLIH